MPRPRTVSDDAVLDAAAALIGSVGPARLTLAHVADASGLAPATLVQRFGSKRGLLLALARRPPGFAERLAAADAGAPSRTAAVVAALVALAAPVRTPAALANNLAFLQLDLGDPEFHAAAAAHFAALREALAEHLGAARAGGELVAAADPGALADMLVTTYNGALITWAVVREGALDGFLRTRLELVLAPWLHA